MGDEGSRVLRLLSGGQRSENVNNINELNSNQDPKVLSASERARATINFWPSLLRYLCVILGRELFCIVTVNRNVICSLYCCKCRQDSFKTLYHCRASDAYGQPRS